MLKLQGGINLSINALKMGLLKTVTGKMLATENCIVCGEEVKRYVGHVICAIGDSNKDGYVEKPVAAGFCIHCSRVIDNKVYCFDENRNKVQLSGDMCLRPYKESMGLTLMSKNDERIWRD